MRSNKMFDSDGRLTDYAFMCGRMDAVDLEDDVRLVLQPLATSFEVYAMERGYQPVFRNEYRNRIKAYEAFELFRDERKILPSSIYCSTCFQWLEKEDDVWVDDMKGKVCPWGEGNLHVPSDLRTSDLWNANP